MKDLLKGIIDFVKEATDENVFLTEFIKKTLEKLKGTQNAEWHEIQFKIRSMLEHFSSFAMACLTVLRSNQSIEKIAELEKSFTKEAEKIQVFVLEKILAPRCIEANENAIEITTYFLHAYPDDVIECAKKVLIEAGESEQGKEIVTRILLGYVPGKTCALSIIAKINPEIGTTLALKLIGNRDEEIRHEALCVIAQSPLEKEIARKMIVFLKSKRSKVPWTDDDHRMVCYDFFKNAFTNGLMTKKEAEELIAKAFEFEGSNSGLSRLLPIIQEILPKNKRTILDGFIAMETRENYSFLFRKESVSKFLSTLRRIWPIKYLRTTLLKSRDREFAWFAGQHLIVTDVEIARETFLEIAKQENPSKEMVGALTQLTMNICNDEDGSRNWEVATLNKRDKSDFFPIAKALFDYAKDTACPTEIRLVIAYQTCMFGANTACCKESIFLLEKILLDENASSTQILECLKALLHCHSEKERLESKIDNIFTKVYASKNKKGFLDQILKIIRLDDSNYPIGPAVSFLENIDATDSVPLLQKALNANSDADADIDLYVSALSKIATKGNGDAVTAISRYRKKNIYGEVIPRALVEIYEQTSLEEIKKQVLREVEERFLLSISKSKDDGIFYLNELIAIEALKNEPFIINAFLKAIEMIGDDSTNRSAGMCGLIEKISEIIPKERKDETQKVLAILIGKLISIRIAYLDKRNSKGLYTKDNDSTIKTLDALSAQAGMVLSSL